ncbi:MAG: membrane protein insertase YidC [Treponema sp.]|jgi:YidC/Oxa1 family membrane protein insertase|nr:membrane protein insertase YidC [Treponema sp.]
MEKNTILAVILSIVVLVGFYLAQGVFFPSKQTAPAVQQPPAAVVATDTPVQELPPSAIQPGEQSSAAQGSAVQPGEPEKPEETADTGPQQVQYVTIETELMTVRLTSSGGDVAFLKLKEHFDNEDFVDMILSGVNEAHAFSVAFGGMDAQPVTSFFHVRRLSDYSVEFYRDFTIPSGASANAGGTFRLIKRYDFKPRDYMFELTITLDGGYSVPGFNFSGNAYTLAFGPQLGPKFVKLDNRYDYRQYMTFINGKRKSAKVNDIIDTRPTWAAISGKYFTFIAIPYLAQYSLTFSEKQEPGIPSASRLYIVRPAANASRIADTYRFYLGPKTQETLAIYNTGKNDFGLKDMNLVEAASTRGILSPLEKVLKWLLLIFYRIVPNYGVAIILLTLLVKIVFFPLTKKSSEATLRMQALAPKIKELQAKHKANPQKMNAEMAEFYKKEGYNPLSGCLPMLLQIPLFIAMYNLFNNHFDLRGAMFIPGWIPDLSVPESVWNFPEGVKLPFLGWTALRLLPFIYVGSQLLYGRVTQTPDQQGNTQMKMMLYVMPIMFFFILYNMPSGLLIYWIFSNILTLVQQVIINKYFLPKRKQEYPQPVIAPGKKKK